jgi:hypothetical protein
MGMNLLSYSIQKIAMSISKLRDPDIYPQQGICYHCGAWNSIWKKNSTCAVCQKNYYNSKEEFVTRSEMLEILNELRFIFSNNTREMQIYNVRELYTTFKEKWDI